MPWAIGSEPLVFPVSRLLIPGPGQSLSPPFIPSPRVERFARRRLWLLGPPRDVGRFTETPSAWPGHRLRLVVGASLLGRVVQKGRGRSLTSRTLGESAGRSLDEFLQYPSVTLAHLDRHSLRESTLVDSTSHPPLASWEFQ